MFLFAENKVLKFSQRIFAEVFNALETVEIVAIATQFTKVFGGE